MKNVILDTNFIISCIEKKIDFFEEITFMGFKVVIPIQVIDELEKLSESSDFHQSNFANLALRIIDKNDYDSLDLKMAYVDQGLIKHGTKNPLDIVATLDTEVKKALHNPKMIIRGKKINIV